MTSSLEKFLTRVLSTDERDRLADVLTEHDVFTADQAKVLFCDGVDYGVRRGFDSRTEDVECLRKMVVILIAQRNNWLSSFCENTGLESAFEKKVADEDGLLNQLAQDRLKERG